MAVGSCVVVDAVLWRLTSHAILLGWLAVMVGAAALRIAMARYFRSSLAEGRNTALAERAFFITLSLSSLVSGVGTMLALPPQSVPYQAIVYLFLMGGVSGAVSNYAAHRLAVLAIVSAMGPSIIWFALKPDTVSRLLAICGVLWVLGSFRAAQMMIFYVSRSNELSYQLRVAQEKAEAQARTDELTGLNNRRAFQEWGAVAVEQWQRYHRSLSILVLDIDFFKRINDTHGHAAGDAVLRHLAALVQQTARSSDFASRLGGEEFAVLLTETSAAEALQAAERLRVLIESSPTTYAGTDIRLTVSIGVAEMEQSCAGLDGLVDRADHALYEAKEQGRNRSRLSVGFDHSSKLAL